MRAFELHLPAAGHKIPRLVFTDSVIEFKQVSVPGPQTLSLRQIILPPRAFPVSDIFSCFRFSSYLVLNRLSLLNTQKAVILPAVFSTFPIFLTYGGFRGIPGQLFEAARVDGAREWYIFFKMGLPLGKSGILSALVLGFLEYWNMMEQPMAFIDDKALWPLSLYLPEIVWGQAGYAFCASVITLIPAAFVFVMGQDYLEQGIIYSGLKE